MRRCKEQYWCHHRERQKKHDFYRVGVKQGLLRGRFSRNQFEVRQEKFVDLCDIDQSRMLSISTAVGQLQADGGRPLRYYQSETFSLSSSPLAWLALLWLVLGTLRTRREALFCGLFVVCLRDTKDVEKKTY